MAGRLLGIVVLLVANARAPLSSSVAHVPAAPVNAVLLVKVVDAASGQPLPNAEVIDLDASTHRFTNTEGEARMIWPDRGRLRLRVRQLGFQFEEREVSRPIEASTAVDTATFALSRVAYVLPDVATRATAHCAAGGDPAARLLAAVALGQLQMSAERYESFRKAYPFQIKQKRRTIHLNPNGTAHDVREGTEDETSNDWGERYRPGRVIDRRANGFSVPLLFLSALADPVFWEHHCFTVRGIEALRDQRVLRLEFEPAVSVSTVDWMGTAFVDSATSVLRRVEFQLAGLRDNDVPRRLEGYTTFRSPSPFIVIPDSTVAMWWRRDPSAYEAPWNGPDTVQLLELLSVRYRKGTPPTSTPPPRR
jgi:hypothetical protein